MCGITFMRQVWYVSQKFNCMVFPSEDTLIPLRFSSRNLSTHFRRHQFNNFGFTNLNRHKNSDSTGSALFQLPSIKSPVLTHLRFVNTDDSFFTHTGSPLPRNYLHLLPGDNTHHILLCFCFLIVLLYIFHGCILLPFFGFCKTVFRVYVWQIFDSDGNHAV